LLVLLALVAALPLPNADYMNTQTGDYDWLKLSKLSEEELVKVLPRDYFEHNVPLEFPPELILSVFEQFQESFPIETDQEAIDNLVEAIKKKREENPNAEIEPLVILPGFLSSALMNTISRPADVPIGCQSSRDVYQIWVNIPNIVRLRCFHNQMSQNLQVERDGNVTYGHAEGSNIRGKDFGNTGGLDTLNFWPPGGGIPVFRAQNDFLESLGWERGVSIRGATYDWTFPGWYYDRFGFYEQLEALIEETFYLNGNKSVHLLGHSMGTLQSLYFLNTRSQAWKDQYIASNIAVTPLYHGAPLAIRAILSGVTNIPLVRWYIQTLIKYWGSLHWFVPNSKWYDPNALFLVTPDREYYLRDMEALFNDAGYPEVATAYPLAYEQTEKMIHPGVEYHCFVVRGVPTDVAFNYTAGFPDPRRGDARPEIIRADGDMLVPFTSAESCKVFSPNSYHEYAKSNHVGILSDPDYLAALLDIISS